MKVISFYAAYANRRRGQHSPNTLHIECDGCIVNIHVGLTDRDGHKVTAVEVLPDRYQDEQWELADAPGKTANVRVRKVTAGD